jgi:hypothetical protein
MLESQLRGRQRDALAGGAKPLPASGRTFDSVIESQLREHAPQIVNLHLRSEARAAACAVRPFVLVPRVLVQLHAELCRTLEDVEELPERQIEQRPDDGNRMEDGQEAVKRPAQPQRRRGQGEPGYRDGVEQDERQEVRRELLQRQRAAVAQPPPHGERDAGQHEHGREIQPVEQHPGNDGADPK